MELTAKLVQMLPVQSGVSKTGNEWKRQNIILETDGMYPKKVCVTLWGDKINEAILIEGNLLDISYDLESREYNGNWYTDVRAWRVELSTGVAPAPGSNPTAPASPPPPPVEFGEDSGDDLPF